MCSTLKDGVTPFYCDNTADVDEVDFEAQCCRLWVHSAAELH